MVVFDTPFGDNDYTVVASEERTPSNMWIFGKTFITKKNESGFTVQTTAASGNTFSSGESYKLNWIAIHK